MRLELGQFNLFYSSVHIIHIHQLNKTNLYKGRQAWTWDDLLKINIILFTKWNMKSFFKSNKSFCNFCYFYHINHKNSLFLFLCTLKILLYILYYAPHWLTHEVHRCFDHLLRTQWKHFLSFHTNRLILKQFRPGWNHKTQNCTRRGQKVLYLTCKSFPVNRKHFRVNKVTSPIRQWNLQ